MNFRAASGVVDLGVGVGFRPKHAADVLHGNPRVDWFEVVSENFMVRGGKPIQNLERLREKHRVVLHGVSMGIGSDEAPSAEYLSELRALAARVDSPWVSDHLCWSRSGGRDLHDLLPLPYTRAMVSRVADRAKRVMDAIRRPFALENASSYMTYRESTMTEWEFLAEVAEAANCGILFDVNNVYVTAFNHGFDAERYVDSVPAERVFQIHLAGHTNKGKYLLDTHSDHVIDAVWKLYERFIRRAGSISTLIEWDEDIPEWSVLEAEAALAQAARKRALDAR